MHLRRRDFLTSIAGLSVAPSLLLGEETPNARWKEELARHRLADVETHSVQMQWPRLVGKNSRLDVHGRGPRTNVCVVKTDRDASGWGTFRGNPNTARTLLEKVKGKAITELFDPAVGVTSDDVLPLDFALHDLAGIILGVPVYRMLGGEGTKATPCYSGMIYFDDLEPPDKPAGIDRVIENCHADYKLGYRQLKVKIGRGNRWMEMGAGLRRDIEVTRAIAKALPMIEILVDGNDGFTPDSMLAYLKGIGDIELFWIEEPFRESVEGYAKLRKWLDANRRKTYLADGEANPDWKVLNELGERRLLDVQLVDIVGYGFTPWRKLMPELKRQKILASPHAWGTQLKTYYTAHLAAGLGNVVTVEGVTCTSPDVDFGTYHLKDGKLVVSEAPGFGMKLIAKK